MSFSHPFKAKSSKDVGLEELNIKYEGPVFHNLTYDEIAAHEEHFKEGQITANGTYAIDTGKFTGRSPKDKFIVKQPPSEDNIWWGNVNQPLDPKVFDTLHSKVLDHFTGAERLYVYDGYCGVAPSNRLSLRIVTELAWQHHFVKNMFISPSSEELKELLDNPDERDFVVLNACKVVDEDWKEHGLNSEVFVVFNIEKKLAIIGGTYYGGEMKKGVFSMMNYYLPQKGVLSMHASATKPVPESNDDRSVLFFGLSGTGKTTLSADPQRSLIGDDEHGWDDEEGLFNFEGGCYAKTIDLKESSEPMIYHAIKRDALLENVWVDPVTKEVDYHNKVKTENGRVSYPLSHIHTHLAANSRDVTSEQLKQVATGRSPSFVIFLTCDAYGVLPPVCFLNTKQALYHFLSGYTAKVAGTERGITEPVATFSPCFGAAFMTLRPSVYAALLEKKIEKFGTKVYLVNTGWTGGPYGAGQRMSLPETRCIITSILDGSIHDSDTMTLAGLGFVIPTEVKGVSSNVLNPRNTWKDPEAYDSTAKLLALKFRENFEQFKMPDLERFAPQGTD